MNNEPEAIGPWQPASTAPTDGTVVLIVADFDARPSIGFINENGDWSRLEETGKGRKTTYWMPLPKMPEGS